MNQKKRRNYQKSLKKKFIKLSIAIPTLNSEKTLHITMNSILKQDTSNFQLKVILIDSGSKDNTEELFFSYGNRLDLYFKNVGKCSIGEARNYAIRNIECDYLIFLDSDDALIKNRFKRDFEILENSPKLNFIYGDSLQINKKSFANSYYCKAFKKADKYQFLNMPYNLSSVTVSRRFLLKNKLFFKSGLEGRLGEDWRFINQINCYENYFYDKNIKVIINSRDDSHTQDSIKCDLSVSRIKFLCELFENKKKCTNFSQKLFFGLQIQSSFFLTLVNTVVYSHPKNTNLLANRLKKIFKVYLKNSCFSKLMNLIFFPISIFLIIFIHRRSIYSPQRKNLSYASYKYFLDFLI